PPTAQSGPRILMDNNRNFFITIALSVAILTLWQVFYMNPRIEAQRETARIEAEQQQAQTQQAPTGTRSADGSSGGTELPSATGGDVPGAPAGGDAVAADGGRIRIDTPSLSGSINLTGARLDDLVLKDYRVT